LRHWTIELPAGSDVADVRARVAAAQIPVEDTAGGFLVRDPWQIAVVFVAPA
jgi:hypothetical protein